MSEPSTVIRFPQERCGFPEVGDYRPEPAMILILPVVRVERSTEHRVRRSIRRLRRALADAAPDMLP